MTNQCDPKFKTVTEYRQYIANNMKRFGGSFVQSLAQCVITADAQNFYKLVVAFPDYFEEYSDPKWTSREVKSS